MSDERYVLVRAKVSSVWPHGVIRYLEILNADGSTTRVQPLLEDIFEPDSLSELWKDKPLPKIKTERKEDELGDKFAVKESNKKKA